MLRVILGLLLFITATQVWSLDTKQIIFTQNAPAPIGVYSQAVKSGNTIYLSGQIGMNNKTGELVKGDFAQEFQQVMSNLTEITKAAGGSLNDIVKLTIYVTDLKNFATINQGMKNYFHEPYPARSVIEIKSLPKNAAVEIEAIMGKKDSI